MHMRVIAVGRRLPKWVGEVFADYVRRLPGTLRIALEELSPGPRGGSRGCSQAIATERDRLLGAVRGEDFVVALDEHGRELTTQELAGWLAQRMRAGQDLAFLIGGPDGLAPAVLERSNFTWSLSRLTLPHALVRVVLAEQLYRAHTVLTGHPYHRE
ncbi:MAG TPA: 23S rRNA (pseudouridine(1915)-N(3))-methyltransferase RlmH [Steroidobacteraceae bacterium]|nr:23S rRNA (pseudouridine(1915)-N(3))-methyltransferase RlmH [Steroidobacteraceae bacterium]